VFEAAKVELMSPLSISDYNERLGALRLPKYKQGI
jgi:hypothetical protein